MWRAGTARGGGRGLLEQGVTLFTVGTGGPDFDLGLAKQWIAWRDAQNATA